MVVIQEEPARPFLNSPEFIRQSLTVHQVKQNKQSSFEPVFNKIIAWFFPSNQFSQLPQKTYHYKNIPS
jgi:hypothetical protein